MLILARLIAIIHGLLILCVISGAVAAISGSLRRNRRACQAFYSIILLVVASDVFLGECVLTRWERSLLEATRPGLSYRSSYIAHYFGFLPPAIHHWIGPLLVVSALAAYPYWLWRDRKVANATQSANLA
jgi:hypothetical protein